MPVNKVVINNQTKIDLTNDTVSSSSLLSGYSAHDRSGSIITGSVTTMTQSELIDFISSLTWNDLENN